MIEKFLTFKLVEKFKHFTDKLYFLVFLENITGKYRKKQRQLLSKQSLIQSSESLLGFLKNKYNGTFSHKSVIKDWFPPKLVAKSKKNAGK